MRRVELRRLDHHGADGRRMHVIASEMTPARDDVRIDMGDAREGWASLPLPPCPDCGGELRHAERGSVPGARRCLACGSRFSVETVREVTS